MWLLVIPLGALVLVLGVVLAVRALPVFSTGRRAHERARMGIATDEIIAAIDRVARGELDHAEALARKVLANASIEQRALAYMVLADVAEARGAFAVEIEHLDRARPLLANILPPPGTDLASFEAALAEHKRLVAWKRAFALGAVGRIDEGAAELEATPRVAGAREAIFARAQALLLARRERWQELDLLMRTCEYVESSALGPRSKLLLATLAARAAAALQGAYRAPALAADVDDDAHRAWVASALGGSSSTVA